MRFWQGETVRITASFLNEAGQIEPVSGVQIQAKRPDGTIATGVPVNDAEGNWYADISSNAPGQWYARISCSSPSAAVSEINFLVVPSQVI